MATNAERQRAWRRRQKERLATLEESAELWQLAVAERDELDDELTGLRANYSRLERRCSDLTVERDALADELAGLRADYSHLERRYAALRAEQEALKRRARTLERPPVERTPVERPRRGLSRLKPWG